MWAARALIAGHFASAGRDEVAASAIYVDDAVLEFPQGREWIRGKANILAFRSAYPAIVITTLVMASTFTPMKTRLQAVVDRRVKPAATAEPALDAATVGAILAAAEDRLRQIAREEFSQTER